MNAERGDKMTATVAANILDDAMYKNIELIITTKVRGEIRGIPYVVDMYDTDPDRLGYSLEMGNGIIDTVFLDEIESIYEVKPIKMPADLSAEEPVA